MIVVGETWSRVCIGAGEPEGDCGRTAAEPRHAGPGHRQQDARQGRSQVRALALAVLTTANRRSCSILSVCHSYCCNRESSVSGSGHIVFVCKPLTLLIFSAIQQVVCYHLSRLKNCTLTNLSLTFPVGSPNVTTTVCVHVRESCDITKMYFRLPLSAVSFWAYSVRTRTFTY